MYHSCLTRNRQCWGVLASWSESSGSSPPPCGACGGLGCVQERLNSPDLSAPPAPSNFPHRARVARGLVVCTPGESAPSWSCEGARECKTCRAAEAEGCGKGPRNPCPPPPRRPPATPPHPMLPPPLSRPPHVPSPDAVQSEVSDTYDVETPPRGRGGDRRTPSRRK